MSHVTLSSMNNIQTFSPIPQNEEEEEPHRALLYDPYADPTDRTFGAVVTSDDNIEDDPTENCPKCNKLSCNRFWVARGRRCLMYSNHAYRECLKRKCQYCLAFFSVLFVVLICAVCFTAVDKAPSVFLQQSESSKGQVDISITPSGRLNTLYLNYSRVADITADSPYSYNSPRFFTSSLVVYDPTCTAYAKSLGHDVSIGGDNSWMYRGDDCTSGCLSNLCGPISSYTTTNLFIIDTELERRMEVGRKWIYDPIPPNQVLIARKLANMLDISAGDTIIVTVSLTASGGLLKQALVKAVDNGGDDVDEYLPNTAAKVWNSASALYIRQVSLTLTVAAVVGSFKAKFADTYTDDMVVMEYQSFMRTVSAQVHPVMQSRNLTYINENLQTKFNISALAHTFTPWSPSEMLVLQEDKLELKWETTQKGLPSILYDFANYILVNLPPQRTTTYLSSNYNKIQADVVSFASKALFNIGFNEVDVYLPTLDGLSPLKMFSLFLGLILSIVLTILCVLALMLIYSLIMISVETRSFEMAVHRMNGLTRLGLVNMIVTQAFSYSLPAWVVGLILSQILSVFIINMMSSAVEVPLDTALTPMGIGISTLLGLLIPLVAAILPIKHVLGQNLHDALDTQHSKIQGVEYTIERSEDQGIPLTGVVLGLGMSVFGFLIYYLLPLSLLSMNLSLFFNIFFGILLGLLFGLILLSLNFEHLIERLLIFIFFFWELRCIPNIVLKNLIAHRKRNRKTTMMYALSLGFVIFITVAYTSELESARATTVKGNGATFVVSGSKYILPNDVANVEAILRNYPAVDSWAWVTLPLESVFDVTDIRTTNIGNIVEHSVNIYGVSPSYFDVALSQYYVANKEDTSTQLSVSEQLYTVRGSQSVVIDEGLRSWTSLGGIDDKGEFKMKMAFDYDKKLVIQGIKPIAVLDSAAGIDFTKFKQDSKYSVVVSMPTYLRWMNYTFSSFSNLYYDKVMISIKGSSKQKKQLAAVLTAYTDVRSDLSFDNSEDSSESMESTKSMLDLIFNIVTYLTLLLCLFSLLASMYSNIYDSAKEIAVLRAVGLTKFQVSRIYVYEAFILVLSSALLGIIIGFVMGWTMLLQRVLFTQLPMQFIFPWTSLYVVLIAAVICAFLASFTPIRVLMSKTIAGAFRTFL